MKVRSFPGRWKNPERVSFSFVLNHTSGADLEKEEDSLNVLSPLRNFVLERERVRERALGKFVFLTNQ